MRSPADALQAEAPRSFRGIPMPLGAAPPPPPPPRFDATSMPADDAKKKGLNIHAKEFEIPKRGLNAHAKEFEAPKGWRFNVHAKEFTPTLTLEEASTGTGAAAEQASDALLYDEQPPEWLRFFADDDDEEDEEETAAPASEGSRGADVSRGTSDDEWPTGPRSGSISPATAEMSPGDVERDMTPYLPGMGNDPNEDMTPIDSDEGKRRGAELLSMLTDFGFGGSMQMSAVKQQPSVPPQAVRAQRLPLSAASAQSFVPRGDVARMTPPSRGQQYDI
eukprot:gnl/TRDRNA2_/TRDRNA2_44870_c0_seq1.p1 gnl/TRDRNA2_/TRDRNA2_44870_c0~~gnl/TRDRNA2_/TRDRNA2_44870_c0_seq1.p1  ORF type:complete len:314 (+),score=69.48 gnl/TRDRNA2_/TRDRNA2_44870_c0_seq1:113-943(+)